MTRKTAILTAIVVILAGLAGYGYWEWSKPAPILPGDKAWCDPIKNKPIEEWSQEEALGFATHNCMQWY